MQIPCGYIMMLVVPWGLHHKAGRQGRDASSVMALRRPWMDGGTALLDAFSLAVSRRWFARYDIHNRIMQSSV